MRALVASSDNCPVSEPNQHRLQTNIGTAKTSNVCLGCNGACRIECYMLRCCRTMSGRKVSYICVWSAPFILAGAGALSHSIYASTTPIRENGASSIKYGIDAFWKSPGCLPNHAQKKTKPRIMHITAMPTNLIRHHPWTDLMP